VFNLWTEPGTIVHKLTTRLGSESAATWESSSHLVTRAGHGDEYKR